VTARTHPDVAAAAMAAVEAGAARTRAMMGSAACPDCAASSGISRGTYRCAAHVAPSPVVRPLVVGIAGRHGRKPTMMYVASVSWKTSSTYALARITYSPDIARAQTFGLRTAVAIANDLLAHFNAMPAVLGRTS